jgi:hypothetical protein
VLDPEGVCFTRAWCHKEFNEAINKAGRSDGGTTSGVGEVGGEEEGVG